jgi:hypothetical protein
MTYHLKSLAVKATAMIIALLLCAAAALLLNRLIGYLDSGVTSPVTYVLPIVEDGKSLSHIKRATF